jgi:hypothetical protein
MTRSVACPVFRIARRPPRSMARCAAAASGSRSLAGTDSSSSPAPSCAPNAPCGPVTHPVVARDKPFDVDRAGERLDDAAWHGRYGLLAGDEFGTPPLVEREDQGYEQQGQASRPRTRRCCRCRARFGAPTTPVVRLDVAKGGLCRLLVRGCFFCIRTTKEASDRHDPSLLAGRPLRDHGRPELGARVLDGAAAPALASDAGAVSTNCRRGCGWSPKSDRPRRARVSTKAITGPRLNSAGRVARPRGATRRGP